MFITESSNSLQRRPSIKQKHRLNKRANTWLIPLLISALFLSHYFGLLPHKLAFAQESPFTVAKREDFPGGQKIPMWDANDGTFLYCGDEFNHHAAQPGATGQIMNPRSYAKLTSPGGSRGGSYTEEQLRAIDYIIYHGSVAHKSQDVYGYTDWKARAITQFALWGVMRGEIHTLASSIPQAELHKPVEQLYADAMRYAHESQDGPEKGAAQFFVPDNDEQVLFFFGKQSGALRITKCSLFEAITNKNKYYTLEGAEYGIFADVECTQSLGTMKLDSTGSASLSGLPVGTLYIKELTAPRGYLLDQTVHTISINNQEESILEVTDTPAGDFNLHITKQDFINNAQEKYPESSLAQGDASLEGAQFKIRYLGSTNETSREWIFSTDKQGVISFEEKYKVSGDNLFSLDNKPWLPLGYYTVEEIKAPEGYQLPSNSLQTWKLSYSEGNLSWTNLTQGKERAESHASLVFNDEVIQGEIRIKKIGHDTLTSGKGYSELDPLPSLKGAKIELVNVSSQSIFYKGKWIAPNEAVTTIETDESGEAKVEELPYGTYSLKEISAPTGYAINSEWNPNISIRDNTVIEAPELQDERIAIQTMLLDSNGTKNPQYSKDLQLIDHIKYEGLTPGEEYEITGELYETKQIQNGPAKPIAKGNVHFKATSSTGEVACPFTVNSTNIEGKDVTAYETISKDGKIVASHTNAHSSEQTLHIKERHKTLPTTADNHFLFPISLALVGCFSFLVSHTIRIKRCKPNK
ncbi:MAG: VaFE repeat-containing surface-anchored protein [Atopobiaceae bacterium]|nr:VaFE repeat-containing surface-anchored protein [Atopobiaceae bacterium]